MADRYKKFEEDFIRLVNENKIFHAYLFFGESADGIMEFSKKLANFLESGEFKNSDKFLNDFLVIKKNENGNIGIDEMRSLQNFLYQKPAISQKRTAIIFEAENLTNEAQSSILKIIEEPPKDTLVILISRSEDLILATIISRVHRIYFPAQTAISAGNKSEITEDADEEIKKKILGLRKNLIQNSGIIKEVLERYTLIKQYNLNKKLQLRLLEKIVKIAK